MPPEILERHLTTNHIHLTRKGTDYFKHLLEFQKLYCQEKVTFDEKSENQVTEQQNILPRRKEVTQLVRN